MGTIKLPKKSIKFFKNNQNKIFKSGNLAEGPWNEKLSKKIKKIANVKNAIGVNSNGSGLVALLLIYKEYYGRADIMIQSNTMYGVKTMTKTAGYNLVNFIDCTLETLMPSFKDLKKAVNNYKNNKNKLVIMLSDIGGIINPDIEKIAKFCKEKNIILIEDSAHSFGAKLNKKFSGTFGNAGVYSYYSTKAIFAGEGGVVVTNDNNIAKLMKDFIAYDRFKRKMNIGCNIRLPELQALMIYSVVKEYKEIIKNKYKIAKKYSEVCTKLNIKFISQKGSLNNGNYYKFIIISPDKKISEALPKIKTVTSKVYEYPLGKSKEIPLKHICLPIWYGLEKSISDKVVKELKASKKYN
jgi:dTDP-4-amino-4,6-dideoxygalactose transaminase